jgi:GNAT superfamily N-acetyltransferase
MTIEVTDYRPENDLDSALADLFRAALDGWPDGQPITAQVVRGWLRPLSLTATTLAVHRDRGGRLLGAAAVRWPGGPESVGRLWGPVVHPDARGARLAIALLAALDEVLDTRPGVRVATANIPESRQAGWSLFERAGWRLSGRSSLLLRPLSQFGANGPGVPVGASDAVSGVAVRTIHQGEYVDPRLAELVAEARPQLSYASARDTFTRWSTDERYTPDGLLLAEMPVDGHAASGTGDVGTRLVGAALVYPMRCPDSAEKTEATLVDMVVAPRLAPPAAAQVRTALVEAVIAAGVKLEARVARAYVDDEDMIAALLAGGFELSDRSRIYAKYSIGHTEPPTAG